MRSSSRSPVRAVKPQSVSNRSTSRGRSPIKKRFRKVSGSSGNSSSGSSSSSRSRSGSSSSSSSSSSSRSRSRGPRRIIRRSRSRSGSPRRRRRSPTPPRATKCHVGTITRNVTKEHLQEIFSVYGTIVHVQVDMNRVLRVNNGTAYVEFKKPEECEKAVKCMNGGQLDGLEITVQPILTAVERRRFSPPRRGMGWRGGGRFGGRMRSPPRFRGRRSPLRRSPLRRRSISPRKRSGSPRRRSFSPRRRSRSPRSSPPIRRRSPMRRSRSPPRRGSSSPPPRRRSPIPRRPIRSRSRSSS